MEETMGEEISASCHDNIRIPISKQVDIAQFVLQVEKFICMTDPFALILYLWDDLRRWRYPVFTVILWTVCNFASIVLSQAAVFTLVSLLVTLIVLVCLVQLHTRILDKFLPDTIKLDSLADEPVDEHYALQTVREFRFSLMQMHEFLSKCNEYLAHFYSLLKWDDTIQSLKFHVEICFLVLCLVVFPTRWTAISLTNWFFLGTDVVYYGCKYRSKLLFEFVQGKRTFLSIFAKCFVCSQNVKLSENSNIGSSQNVKDPANGSVSRETDMEETSLLTDSDKLCGESLEEEGSGDYASAEEPKQGMVARLLELKRRRKIISAECCFKCNASFSSILKRRYTCCHCGNNFCSRCCNQKVPKSLLGATAPSAQTETVLVCVACYQLLQEEGQERESKEKTS